MSQSHDELRAAQRCVDQLTVHISRLEREFGPGLETRRLRADARHLREGLALLAASPGRRPDASAAADAEPIAVPEAPYDRSLWRDADDEGLGARHGPARP
ncbi:hypothetical protein SAMN06297387_102473 [Streptomyces zhaozhouensis]|uniref:Uncharacterized protein n=1 Tax=Streptomyces zhaozhouensis TaxID=1300267 RepID=A0A286DQV3_9ACTN|nr:hypothetical protein [Streptomyces zhaozhouensis]SOD61057.1 hypothetical protein SAMN06297387_102473 [Streptomyces zhaozhouensis]